VIPKTEWIWMNGDFVKWDDAKVHVLAHSLHYGSGIFEGIRCYNTPKGPAIFRLHDHMKRLEDSAKIHKIKMPYSGKELADATIELVKLNKLKECYIRPLVFYGFGEMKLSPLNCPVETIIAAFPFGTYLGKEALEKGVRCKVSSWIRITANILPPQAKCSANYANSILAHREAVDAGCDEAIMLDHKGNISEGPGENVFIVRDNTLLTPPLESDILRGITRHSLIIIARDLGIRVIERHIPRDEIYVADEAFFSGTAAEITPITEVDGRIVGDGKRGPITKKLQSVFFNVVRGKVPKYKNWLTPVK